jgi:hypothetical protein
MRLCDEDGSVGQHGCVLLLCSGISKYHVAIAIVTAVRALSVVKT